MYEGGGSAGMQAQSSRPQDYNPSTTAPGNRQPGIQASLSTQQKLLEETHQVLSMLEQRLESVMGSGGPQPGPSSEKVRDGAACSLSALLDNHNAAIGVLSRRITSILQRLEV